MSQALHLIAVIAFALAVGDAATAQTAAARQGAVIERAARVVAQVRDAQRMQPAVARFPRPTACGAALRPTITPARSALAVDDAAGAIDLIARGRRRGAARGRA